MTTPEANTTTAAGDLPVAGSVAVIGAGVAGLTAAWLLQRVADVHLYEREDTPGGHTHTVVLPDGPDAGTPVDMGFIVMNHRNYPLLTRLFEQWRVELGDSDMSFGYRDERTGYTYAGTNLAGLFAQPVNLVRAAHWRLLRDIARFNADALRHLREGDWRSETLGEYLDRGAYSREFAEHYLLAMGGAIWSSPASEIRQFPVRAFVGFFRNHGLLTPNRRPQWRYVRGGSQTYVRAMLRAFTGKLFTGARLRDVRRDAQGAVLRLADGQLRRYRHVVLATHADEALALLADPTPRERELLGAWRYQVNDTVLHTDPALLPRQRHAWASWNFLRAADDADGGHPVAITYHMNRLQRLRTRQPYFVTLNRAPADPARIITRVRFTHPLYTFDAFATQAPLRDLNGSANTWYCGAYHGYGFHEDAVRSAAAVAAHFGATL